MSSNPEDFFVVVKATWNGPDTVYEQHLNTGYLEGLIQRPDQDTSDLDLAIALLDLIRDDLLLSGTNGQQRISDAGMRIAVRAFERTAARAGYEMSIPFRDHTSWKTYWLQRARPAAGRPGEGCSARSLTGPTRCSSPPRTGRWSRPWPRVSHREIAWGGQRSTSRSESYVVTSA